MSMLIRPYITVHSRYATKNLGQLNYLNCIQSNTKTIENCTANSMGAITNTTSEPTWKCTSGSMSIPDLSMLHVLKEVHCQMEHEQAYQD